MTQETSDISNTVNDAVGAGRNVANSIKREAGELKNQTVRNLKDVSSQAQDGLEALGDEAYAVKKAVVNYVSAKPVTSIALAVGALYLLRKFSR
jgi:ElaB/YqjD/DUF883 family membrane-anchored ribosome-binding protein